MCTSCISRWLNRVEMLFSLDMTIFNFKINYMRRQQASCCFFPLFRTERLERNYKECRDRKAINIITLASSLLASPIPFFFLYFLSFFIYFFFFQIMSYSRYAQIGHHRGENGLEVLKPNLCNPNQSNY